MNKKYILKKDEERVYCIIDGEKPQQEEWGKVFSIEKGHGLTAELIRGEVVVRNYFRADNLASFPVLEVLDTEEETVYILTKME